MSDTRHLLVLRHAKSAWPDVPDRDRPLANRGRRDAPAAGEWLRASRWRTLDHVLCSPARRTQDTWELARRELRAQPPVAFDERIYQATAERLLDVVREAPGTARTLLVVGHHPSVQELTLSLARAAAEDAMRRVETKFPTAAIAVLRVEGPWSLLRARSAFLEAFVVPRGRK